MRQAYPADSWKEALPLGCGSLAALVHGGIARETILLNHEQLWGGAKTPPLPDVSGVLPDLRALLDTGQYPEANLVYPAALKDAGYQAKTAAYMPGPDLFIEEQALAGFSDYERTLDCRTGEVRVTWREGEEARERRAFVSMADEVFVLHVPPRKRGPAIRLRLSWALHTLRDAFNQRLKEVPLDSRVTKLSFPLGSGIEVDLGNGCRYAAALRVNGGEVTGADDITEVLAAPGGGLTIVACLVPLAEAGAATLYARLGELPRDHATLWRSHLKKRLPVADRLRFSLGGAEKDRDRANEDLLREAYRGCLPPVLMERLFHFGRHLLISSSRPGGLPAHLQGKWNGDYAPPWSSAYFNNENLQMSYWQALPGNLPETLPPIFDLYDRLKEDFRENARKLFGCRGLLLPLYMSPDSGLQKDLQPHVVYWTGAGAWLAQLYYEYWLFTGDRKFLAERAVPFMLEVAQFYEDFLVVAPDGRLKIYPGNSPENHPAGPWGEKDVDVCINATMDVALVRELLGNLLAAAEALGPDGPVTAAKAGQWRATLSALPDYEVGADGAFREWLHPDFGENHEHRHISHIYPFFPGYEIRRDRMPELFAAIKTSVDKRLGIGIAEQTGWSLVHLANIFARLGDGERADECLRYLVRSCVGSTLFTYHNDHRGMGVTMEMRWGWTPPLQLDANLGIPAAVLEMLVYSEVGYVGILPAPSPAWRRGEIGWVCCRGGAEAAFSWDADTGFLHLTLRSHRELSLDVQLPAFVPDSVSGAVDGLLTVVVTPDAPFELIVSPPPKSEPRRLVTMSA
jgi:alpha-L-fucosidase 2